MRLARLRRWSQIVFLALFLFLLARTEFRGSFRAQPAAEIRLPYPVSLFLQADPLVALTNALAGLSLYPGLLWCLVILIPTFFLGRFFCGWICPLGTLNHFVSSWKSEAKRGRRLIESNRYRRWQRWKYFVLLAVLAAALVGSGIAGWLDPIPLLVRSLALSVMPALQWSVDGLLELLYRTDSWALVLTAEGLGFLFHHTLGSFRALHFHQAFLLGLVLLVILALNLRVTRLWCRAVCPLGALLGLASRWAILGLEKRQAACGDCNRCLLHCQGGDEPIPGSRWRKTECHLCFNCVADCPEAGLRFRFFPAKDDAAERPDLGRRHLVGSLAAGLAVVPLLRAAPGLSAGGNERRIRPPGALAEEQFLARCIRCGQCMKVCPNNALHPALAEAGAEGLWTPVLVPRLGYCETSCVLCSQVCPTGAIWEITPREKGWSESGTNPSKPVRIGTAFIDRGRCLPWAMATECIVCEEWCPTSPKAIYLRPAEVPGPDGKPVAVRQPWVNPEICVGCGACEYACPVQDRPAIYVTSVGESRSRANQILLERRKRPQA
ncbi:MAG: 4Fe-4S binding protein [Bryobacterales bacterium]|nr:4Fe-4S binding protein [Bryobacteraceae bacterium]MDW8129640.1 4Fe-4S binding protein [Bryobacterales bacterium]